MGSEGASKLYLIPLAVFIMFPLTFIITYSTALANDHIVAFFAYISDTGTLSPEMNIFTLMLNLCGVLIGFTAYIRFKQVELYFIRAESKSKMDKINMAGLVFGMIAALGSSVVGSFQQNHTLTMHVVGAFMAFGGGSIFMIFQAYFTFKMFPLFGTKVLATFRMLIGVSSLILFLTSYITGTISVLNKNEQGGYLKWKPEDGAWTLRVLSVVTEWIMASLLDLFFLTFVFEFKKINISGPKFSFIHNDEPRGHNGKSAAKKLRSVANDDV